jgi:serine/threonine-protein kinase RsbW
MGGHADPASLTIEADGQRLADVRAFIRALAAATGADEESTADLVQAVDELVCNVIEHGYLGGPGTIEVDAQVTGETIVVRIRDRAPAFDPRSVPPPDLDLPLERRPLGGMGIHLARTLTDRLDHRILPGGGNEVTLSKRLRPRTARESNDGDHDRPAERRPRGHRPGR